MTFYKVKVAVPPADSPVTLEQRYYFTCACPIAKATAVKGFENNTLSVGENVLSEMIECLCLIVAWLKYRNS